MECYRYGFNGKENDNEVKGTGNEIDYGMRVYDPRVGRFFSVDPLQKTYPQFTPYQFSGNTPIEAADLDGLEPWHCSAGDDPTDRRTPVQKFTDWLFNTPTAQKVGDLGGNDVNTVKDFYFPDPNKPVVPLAQALLSTANISLLFIFPGESAGTSDAPLKTVSERSSLLKVETSTEKTANRSTTNIHGGNPESANANSIRTPTFTYEGQTYDINATVPYKRPTNATTEAQRKAVNQPNAKCVTCGTPVGPFNADHKTPLAVEHLNTGAIDKIKMRSLKAVQSQCRNCSNIQGGTLNNVVRKANKQIKSLNTNDNGIKNINIVNTNTNGQSH